MIQWCHVYITLYHGKTTVIYLCEDNVIFYKFNNIRVGCICLYCVFWLICAVKWIDRVSFPSVFRFCRTAFA